MARTLLTSGRRINTNSQAGPADGYMTRLVKYVPTEFISIFLAVNNFVLGDSKGPRLSTQTYWIVAAILLIANAIYIWRATSANGQPPATTQIVVSTILYAIFIYSIGGPFQEAQQAHQISWYSATYAAILLPVALFIAGFIVPKPVPVAVQTPTK